VSRRLLAGHDNRPLRILGIFAGWRLQAYGYALAEIYAGLMLHFYLAGAWIIDRAGMPVYSDFTDAWVAGIEALRGNAAQIYEPAEFIRIQSALLGARDFFYPNWPYPPTFLLILAPFGELAVALAASNQYRAFASAAATAALLAAASIAAFGSGPWLAFPRGLVTQSSLNLFADSDSNWSAPDSLWLGPRPTRWGRSCLGHARRHRGRSRDNRVVGLAVRGALRAEGGNAVRRDAHRDALRVCL
jgi:hypothetical protein